MEDAAGKTQQKIAGSGSAATAPPDQAPGRIAPAAAPIESGHQDHWRTLMVDLVYLFNATFRDAHYWEGVKTEKDTFQQFAAVLSELDQLPQHDGVIHIIHRGSASAKVPEKIDYLIQIGTVSLDLPAVAAMIKRVGIRVKHLEGRLTQSFRTLSLQGIKTLDIKMPGADPQSLGRLKTALQITASFNQAVEKETGIKFDKDGRPASVALVSNDTGQPDPNLTILAALNNLDSAGAQELVNKILALRKNPKIAASGLMGLSLYKTIFAFKPLREKLVRPPIEVNADRVSVSGTGSGGGSGSGGRGVAAGGAAGTPQPIMGEAVSKAEIASYVMETYGASPGNAAQVMKSIYSADYRQLGSQNIGNRLATLTTVLERLDKSEKGRKVMEMVIRQIQSGLDQVSADTLDDLLVHDGEVKLWDGETVKSVATIGDRLAGIIKTTKSRSAHKRRLQAVVNWENGFAEKDYDQIAVDYGIRREHAERICNLFQKCIDPNGHFQRAAFEKQIPAFTEHPKKVFEILWGFLRIASRREDRLPFLNSFQLLNREIKQPIKIVRFLLGDFIVDPTAISFPDRNAMMLVIQCQRTYNKECHIDIELTPEEVLLAKVGLDPKVANYTAWKVDGSQEDVTAKIVTIRKCLIEALEKSGRMAEDMDFHYLLALEREVHILLALCGGKTAAEIVRGGLNVYGNPESEIYKIEGGLPHVGSFIQHLSVLIRAIARLGETEDIAVLGEIKKHQRSFALMDDSPRHQAMVRRVLGLADPAIREIQNRKAATETIEPMPV